MEQSQPAPKAQRTALSSTAALYAGFTLLGMATSVLGPTLPGLAENTRSVLSEISFLFMARSFGYLVGSQQGGRLYDRLPGNLLMAGVLTVMGVSLALVPVVSLLILLTLLVFVLGMAEATVDVGGNTLLVWLHGSGVGPFMNGLHFFFGVGAFLSPILVAQAILRTEGISWAYWGLALLFLPVIVWVLQMPAPLSQAAARPEEAARPVRTFLVVILALFFFLYVGAEVSFGGWIYTYALRQMGADFAADPQLSASAAYLTSAFWGALTVGRLLAIPIAMRARARTILFVDLLGALLSVGAILLWPREWTVIWGGTLGAGLFLASVFPTTMVLAGRRMPISGKVTGWFFVGAGAGGMGLPWLIGQLFDRLGPQVTMIAILLDLLVGLMLFFALMVSTGELKPGGGERARRQ